MTDPDYRALCAELLQELYCCYKPWELKEGPYSDAMKRANAALAQPEPVAPTDAEIMEVFWDHQNGLEELWADDWPAAARAVLARWGTPAINTSEEN